MTPSNFEEFCGGPVWDVNLTWHADVPEVTQCFQQTIPVWVPACVFCVLLPLYLVYLSRESGQATHRRTLNILKLVFGCLLVVVCVAELSHNSILFARSLVPPVMILSPTVKCLTFVAAVVLMEVERRKHVISSGIMFIFWLAHVVFGLITFYSLTLQLTRQVGDTNLIIRAATFYIYFVLLLIQFVLSCFADTPYTETVFYPEYRKSFLSRITFTWMNSLIVKGYRAPLEERDVWEVDPYDSSMTTGPELDIAWQYELEKCNWFNKNERNTRLKRQLSRAISVVTHESDKTNGNLQTNAADEEVVVKSSVKKAGPSFFKALAKTYGLTLVQSHSCKLACDILTFVGPLLQSQLIEFTEDQKAPLWRGILYAMLFLVNSLVNGFFFQQLYHIGLKLGMRVKSATMAAIYKKALTVSSEAWKDTTVGCVVNLMSVDAQRLQDVTGYLWMVWSSPLQILIAVLMLWHMLGVSVLAGVFLMFLLLPANIFLATRQRRLQQDQLVEKDKRIKLMNDILHGIKILKLYAWELSFKDKVAAVRNLELSTLQKYSYLAAVGSFTWTLAPFAVMLSTFTAYVLSGHFLTPQTAFVSLSLFNILHFPISLLPVMISNIITANVSIQRIGDFLRQGEIDTDFVTNRPNAAHPIQIKDGTFTWATGEKDDPTLKNVNLSVKQGTLVAVVGHVGAGKSSLLSAILGEMAKLDGSVNVKGRVAYVAQEAWIQNDTVRANILFGKQYNRRKYDKVLEACALTSDLEILPGGDMTEIGEKGLNLSGGQRQRVSLARAVYNGADVYLMDDPLSAVDSHVGKHIFEEVIGKRGILQNKTRLMVTHGLHWLPNTDHVIVLTNGEISETGTCDELLSREGPFAEFAKTYLLSDMEKGDEDDPEIKKVKEAMLMRVDSMATPNTPKTVIASLSWTPAAALAMVAKRRQSARRRTEAHDLRRLTRNIMRQISINGGKKSSPSSDTRKLIEDEKREVGSVKWRVFLAYGRALGLVNAAILLTSFLLFQSTSVFANVWISRWTADPILSNETLSATSSEYVTRRNIFLGVYCGLGLGQGFFILIYALVCAFSMVKASRSLHDDMLLGVLRSPMVFFDTTPSGRVLNRFSRDVDTVDNTLPQLIRSWMNAFFTVMSSLLVIGYSTPIFLAVVVPLGVAYYFIKRFYIPTSRQLKRLESTSRSPIYSHFSESIAGASTIRAFRQQDRFMDRSNDLVDGNIVFYLASISANRWLGFRLDMMSACIVFGAALFAVLGRGSVTAGLVGLSISYALQATSELNWMVRVTSDLECNVVSVERVREYTETPAEAEWYIEKDKPSPDWPTEGRVDFKDYSTRYRAGLNLVLHNITLTIRAGEKIGVVGRTGAGKSSLTLALFRLLEAADGEVTIDGVRIADVGLHQLRAKIAILPQEAIIFSGTLRTNLDPLGKRTDDALWRALEKAHLKDFVSGVPAELGYECGEGGQNLSVGQRQLVCLARALLHKTKILVLDEATAAVDLKTDRLVQETIREEFADSTIIVIAHRLNTIMDSDRIMVLESGRVAELGSPSELLSNTSGIFHEMAKDARLITEENTNLTVNHS